LELIWDLEFVIWDFERYAFCALHNMNLEATFPPNMFNSKNYGEKIKTSKG